MQKTGNFLIDFMSKKIVPLDSACVFPFYVVYFNAFASFRQGYFLSIQSVI